MCGRFTQAYTWAEVCTFLDEIGPARGSGICAPLQQAEIENWGNCGNSRLAARDRREAVAGRRNISPVRALFQRRDPLDGGLWAMSKITELNDHFRITLDQRLGTVMLTDAVTTRHFTVQMSVMEAVKTFNAFTQDNDPRGEHDFGEFEVGGERYCWKIDYCDPALHFCSEEPADPNSKIRLLTIMFSDEYWNGLTTS